MTPLTHSELSASFEMSKEKPESLPALTTDPEIMAEHFRIQYSPTPFNASSLEKDGNRVGYPRLAQMALVDHFDLNHASLDKCPPSEVVSDLLLVAINNAFFRRLENNDNKHIPEDCDDRSAELFIEACQGTADQAELLELLQRQPGLESVELAKETNPFIWDETTEMDDSVADALTGLQKLDGTPRHYFSATDPRCEALIVVRKKDIAEDGNLVVVQRDCFVIDLAQPATETMRLQLMEVADDLMQPSRNVLLDPSSSLGNLISNLIEPEMFTDGNHPTTLYPGARSYYANYRPL